MKNPSTSDNQTTRRIRSIASTAALAAALAVSLPQPAHADNVTPPPVPDGLEVPEGNRAFLVGHAVGSQNYVCLPSGAGFAWTLFTPQATLFDDHGRQLITHFFSPNPFENRIVRATWQHSRDTSTIWARLFAPPSTAAPFVAEGAVAWLVLEVVPPPDGTRGGGALSRTTFVQRLNTLGGVAPTTGCAEPANVGRTVFVPYKADYFFFSDRDDDDGHDGHDRH
jgi:hypothetical protein